MRPLEATIVALCEDRLGRRPDLESPSGYNDKIQWLKLHDQQREQITACDKWAVRDWVAERAGREVLIPARLGLGCGIVKCTHDSGSARRVRRWPEIKPARVFMKGRLARPYGIDKGEWAYRFIPPQIMTEVVLGDPTDYKFHCAHGKILWALVVRDRAGKPRETTLAPDGRVLPLHWHPKMIHAPDARAYPGDDAWLQMTALVEKLAAGWRYVRVDLYWSEGKAWFGELTFWPMAGCITTADEPIFGEMLEIDMTEKREPIVA